MKLTQDCRAGSMFASAHWLCLLSVLFAAGGPIAFSGQMAPPPVAKLPLLTAVQQIHQLTVNQAKLGYPVHLRAVVTYFDDSEPDLFVQDSTGGIWVDLVGTKLTASPGE